MADKRELKMFGCEIEPFVKSCEDSIAFKFSGMGMVIISMLSDVQEMIERDMKEDARQTINRVKYLVDKQLPSKRGRG